MNLIEWKNARAKAFPTLGKDLDIWEIMQFVAADLPHVAIIDTETTGLRHDDEILELSIVSPLENRNITWRFGTEQKTEWPEAERVNGISPEDVEGLEPFASCRAEILGEMSRYSVFVGYNVDFDLGMMLQGGIRPPLKPTFDVMAEAREMLTVPNPDGFRPWISLVRACEQTGVEWRGPSHNSYFDCCATWDLMIRLHQINLDILPFKIRNDLIAVYESCAEVHGFHGLKPWVMREMMGL